MRGAVKGEEVRLDAIQLPRDELTVVATGKHDFICIAVGEAREGRELCELLFAGHIACWMSRAIVGNCNIRRSCFQRHYIRGHFSRSLIYKWPYGSPTVEVWRVAKIFDG